MRPMLYFNTGTEDSLAVDAGRLYAIDGGNDVVNLYFDAHSNGSVISSVVLTVADGDSDQAVRDVAEAIAGARAGEVLVIADDANSKYVTAKVTACAAITVDITAAHS